MGHYARTVNGIAGHSENVFLRIIEALDLDPSTAGIFFTEHNPDMWLGFRVSPPIDMEAEFTGCFTSIAPNSDEYRELVQFFGEKGAKYIADKYNSNMFDGLEFTADNRQICRNANVKQRLAQLDWEIPKWLLSEDISF